MVHVIAIGRLRSGPEAELVARYTARLRPTPAIVEVAEARGAPAEAKRREGAALLACVPPHAFTVALDLGGQALDSEAFARQLSQWQGSGRTVCFLIGGAEGLDAAVLQQADFALSLGPLTWPHFLVRAMLAEQLYRAQSIAAGHPYHRAARP